MTSISGFTFVHNAIHSGYPIVEAIRAVQPYVNEIVVIDMQSTDDTREVLEKLSETCLELGNKVGGERGCNCAPIRIINGEWGNQAGETLRKAHIRYWQCSGDEIIHFEADEVYEPTLLKNIVRLVNQGIGDIAVYRLQLEQNFQRCRWYPEPVHRVFSRMGQTQKDGHTTDRHSQATVLGPENGYLWDITNCFRDNWMNRIEKQAELRGADIQYLMTPIHSIQSAELSKAKAELLLYGQHWEWTTTPFKIPEILKPLVGMVKYEPRV